MTPANFSFFLPQLAKHGVEFILIGGGAAIAHGLGRSTYDVDIVYARTDANYEKLVTALDGIQLYYRDAPPGLPFSWDTETLRQGLNFTFTSTKGAIDLLGEATGDGTYDKLLPNAEQIELYGQKIHVVSLSQLIALKRAAGRPRDFETIAELETLRDQDETN